MESTCFSKKHVQKRRKLCTALIASYLLLRGYKLSAISVALSSPRVSIKPCCSYGDSCIPAINLWDGEKSFQPSKIEIAQAATPKPRMHTWLNFTQHPMFHNLTEAGKCIRISKNFSLCHLINLDINKSWTMKGLAPHSSVTMFSTEFTFPGTVTFLSCASLSPMTLMLLSWDLLRISVMILPCLPITFPARSRGTWTISMLNSIIILAWVNASIVYCTRKKDHRQRKTIPYCFTDREEFHYMHIINDVDLGFIRRP